MKTQGDDSHVNSRPPPATGTEDGGNPRAKRKTRTRLSARGSETAQPCQHLDSGLVASRAAGYISVDFSHVFLVFGDSSPKKMNSFYNTEEPRKHDAA